MQESSGAHLSSESRLMQRDMAGLTVTLAFAPELAVIGFCLGVVQASRVSSRRAYRRLSIAS